LAAGRGYQKSARPRDKTYRRILLKNMPSKSAGTMAGETLLSRLVTVSLQDSIDTLATHAEAVSYLL
jgi:hypothetical protein